MNDRFYFCTTPSKVIFVHDTQYRHAPIMVIHRLNPDYPQECLETPGLRCKPDIERIFASSIHKYNNLMVVLERNWSVVSNEGQKVLTSFWDLRAEPCFLKEEDLMDKFPSEIWTRNEESEAELTNVDIKLSTEIMAVCLKIKTTEYETQDESFESAILLYQVNTSEPSQDQDFLRIVKLVKHSENPVIKIGINEKYLICRMSDEDGHDFLEASDIETLLSAGDTKSAKKCVVPISIFDNFKLEPGMSDRLAVYNTKKHRLKILELATTKPFNVVDTIQWRLEGQPSELKDVTDKRCKIVDVGGNWCCGSFLFLQRIELQNMESRQWEFKLSIVDPGTVGKKPVEVVSGIKEIWDTRISFPKYSDAEYVLIDVRGVVYAVSQGSMCFKVNDLSIHCAQFDSAANRNAVQAGCSMALKDSSNDTVDSGLHFSYYIG